MKAVTFSIYRAGDGWRGVVNADGDEYARVFTATFGEALEALVPYARSLADEAMSVSS